MRVTYRRYSKYADEVILQYVQQNPGNLQHAFRLAAFHLSRSIRGIEQRYYNHLYNNYKVHYSYRQSMNSYNPLVKKERKLKDKITISIGKYSISIKER